MTADPPVPLRRNRDFMILWSSQVVSTVGTRVSSIAYPLLVLALTRSPALAGLVAFAQTLPYLLVSLPAGALVDRWDRKRLMIACEAGRAVALGSVAFALAIDRITVAQLVLVAFVEGTLFVFFDIAEGAALPQLVAAEQLPAAQAQNQARMQGADLVGQPLGGLLFAASRLLPFLVDAISYAVSVVALLLIRRPFQRSREPAVFNWPATPPQNPLRRAPARTRLWHDVVEGLRFVWRQPFLRTGVVIIAGINFVFNGAYLALIVRARDLGASAALIGAMFAFFGGGALIGALLAPWFQRRVKPRAAVVGITWLWTVQIAVLVLLPNALALGIVAGIGALAGPPFNVVVGTVTYAVTPDQMLGRVRSSLRIVAWGSIPFGALTAGLLAEHLGAGPALLVFASVMLVVGVLTTVAPGMRQLPTAVPAEVPASA
jgi:MFS family permease